MKFCTNCGKKTVEKKICDKCETEFDTSHNFCKWCGTEISEKDTKCPNCGEKIKKEYILITIVKYIFGVFFILGGLAGLGNSLVYALPMILFGILLLPIVKNLIKQITCPKGKINKVVSIIRIVLLVVLILISFIVAPPSDSNDMNNDNGPTSDNADSEEQVIFSGEQAIALAKEYIANNSVYLEQKIADECNFSRYYAPIYATYDYHHNPSSWTVYVDGNIYGYTDNYATNLVNYKFTISFSVQENGEIKISNIKIIKY